MQVKFQTQHESTSDLLSQRIEHIDLDIDRRQVIIRFDKTPDMQSILSRVVYRGTQNLIISDGDTTWALVVQPAPCINYKGKWCEMKFTIFARTKEVNTNEETQT